VAGHEAIHGAIANSELVVIPSAKHFVNVEQSSTFNDVLTRFLAEQVGRTAQAAE
jgi:pimeloyl-ACP methyl ester carboxylesterase